MVTHHLKDKDDLRRPGIAAEVMACQKLAEIGKHVLRLPENVPKLIDDISIVGTPYRELLKFKSGEKDPRGYPDAYFDGQTWDFKAPEFQNNVDSLRQLIKDGRKASNVIFIAKNPSNIRLLREALFREIGRQKKNGLWLELPNIYYMLNNSCKCLWKK